MSNIHLTGHKGLVGSAINTEINAITYNQRIEDFSEYSNFLKESKIDTIIHAAARVGGVLDNQTNKIEFYLKNSKLNNIVFESALNNNIQNFINLSSTCVFPDNAPYPLKEEYIFMGEPHQSNNGYAYSKRVMQYLCSEARKTGLNYLTIIPTNVFGINDNFNLDKGHVLPALIHKCYLAKENNDDLIIWGTGKPLREFIYSKDLAKIIQLILNSNISFDSLIVSNSQQITISECVEKITNIVGFKGKIIYDNTKPDGQYRKPTDISRFKEILPDFKFSNFDESLEETIDWFVNNYNILRK